MCLAQWLAYSKHSINDIFVPRYTDILHIIYAISILGYNQNIKNQICNGCMSDETYIYIYNAEQYIISRIRKWLNGMRTEKWMDVLADSSKQLILDMC